ncbi:hypothetical protein A5893_05175 [Pedobacter psychrophilus]|uniref:Major facilitator superfamily (MFS) profile domain-containing protein n=1 Tax=Pedobacter psychrophilus TaxID=1826909 RepID=A0A179DGY9_9SPHI|nr:sugar porter family MFS transporter [Pedobacter psychrophilus]OAQ40346.1 hypothetical protein A5893_05175 [Pedobacter psychrophilus]
MITKDRSRTKVVFNCIAAAVGGLLFGFDTAVISGTIEFISGQYSLNTNMEGWFVSSGLAGCILGVIVVGLISNKLGRKPILLLSGFLFLLSAVGCAWASNIEQLILFRLAGGLGVGIASVICPLYITEFSPSKIRGRMVAFYQLAITIGILLAYFSNSYLLSLSNEIISGSDFYVWFFKQEVWRSMFVVMSIPSLIFMLLMAFTSESPRWLISKNKGDKALKILRATNPSETATVMYNEIQEASAKRGSATRSIFHKSLRIPLLTGALLCIFQQFSGINAIIYYGPKIFSQAGLSDTNALNTQVIIGLVNVLFTFVAITQSDKLGRKKLLVYGLCGMILSLITVGFCFYFNYTENFLLISMLVFFIACFALSAGPITWILISEIFPDDVRTKAVSFCTFILWGAVWVVGQFFPWLLQNIGSAGVFWVFAGFSTLSLIFCLKVLKETMGKSLEEIETIYAVGH